MRIAENRTNFNTIVIDLNFGVNKNIKTKGALTKRSFIAVILK